MTACAVKKSLKKDYDARRYAERKSEIDARNKKWAALNPEKYRGAIERWREVNKLHVKATVKAYGEKHRGAMLVAMKKRRRERPDIYRAIQRRYLERNPGARAIIRANREGDSRHSLDTRIPRRLLRIQSNCCVTCGKDIRDGFHIDHVIPRARGGKHLEGNLQLLCPPCNLSKGSRLPIEWRVWKRTVGY